MSARRSPAMLASSADSATQIDTFDVLSRVVSSNLHGAIETGCTAEVP